MASVATWIATGEEDCEYRRVPVLEHWLAPEALRFWEQRPADGIMIGRDVPSRAIARLLNRNIVYQPVDSGGDLKVRLAGSALRQRFEHDVTGWKMSEMFGPAAFPIRFRTTMEAIESGKPRMVRVAHKINNLEILHLELLILPVVAPSGGDRWALVFCFYF